MIRLASWVVGLVAFSVSAGAFAQDENPVTEPAPEAASAPVAEASTGASTGGGFADKKIRLGLRLGYGLPLGSVADGSKMSDGLSGQIPIWIDAGYMVTPNVLVGLYGQYGFALTKNCPTGDDCSAHDIRFGIQAQYHLMPAESVDPWLGLGFGYEILGVSQTTQGFTVSGDVKGFEFVNLQGGADFKVADAVAVGPFVSFSLGQYSTASQGDVSADIQNTALHEWLTLGVKGTFGL
ncbi:MAG: hypothetical protein WDO69_04795 [Pseudomonadota bacterium]